MMTVKEELYEACKVFLDDRLQAVLDRIANIQESLKSETKSSAGDKHETGRAMLQLEREKAGNQLADIQKQQQLFSRVAIEGVSDVARLGSIVYTSLGTYFLAISFGVIEVQSENYFVVSPETPIGRLVLGKRVGDIFSFKGIDRAITAIK